MILQRDIQDISFTRIYRVSRNKRSDTRIMKVFVRWRPLVEDEMEHGEISRTTNLPGNSNGKQRTSITIDHQESVRDGTWKSLPAFDAVLEAEDDNACTYNKIVAPTLPVLLKGRSCTFFAYGHSGSGKTHTIIGYDREHHDQLGLCIAAARDIFTSLATLNHEGQVGDMGIGLSLIELRKNAAFDLLNQHTKCFIREGYDGKIHIRGPTESIEGGKVRVCPVVQRPCWTFESFRKEFHEALLARTVGSSSVHDQSSRTHAVIELEVINQSLVEARQALYDRQSELVPVGKKADDISIEEQRMGFIPTPEGGGVPNPQYEINQERIDAALAEKTIYESRVKSAEEYVHQILATRPCLGGKMLFVDLAGAEYQTDKRSQPQIVKQTPQERQEGRQINTDLLALKEVIGAWSTGQPRIPFRSSPLTMVLRDHFEKLEEGSAAMIVTVSPAKNHLTATLNTLKYGSLVGSPTGTLDVATS